MIMNENDYLVSKYSGWKWWEIQNEKLLPKLIDDGAIEHYKINNCLLYEDSQIITLNDSSIYFLNNKLSICDSGRGRVLFDNFYKKSNFLGYTRGLDFSENFYFIGNNFSTYLG